MNTGNNKLYIVKQIDLKKFDKYEIVKDIIYAFIDGKFKIYNINGREITKKPYQYIGKYNNGVCVVMNNNKYSFIDKEGNEVINETYDYISDFKNNVAIVRKGKRYGLISVRGDLLISINSYDIKFLDNGLIAAKKRFLKRKISRINNQNVISYEEIKGKFKYYLYDMHSMYITDKCYDEIISCGDNFCVVKADNKFGLINEIAEEVIKVKYDGFSFDEKGIIFYLKNKSYLLEINDINIKDILNNEIAKKINPDNLIVFKDSLDKIDIKNKKNKISK